MEHPGVPGMAVALLYRNEGCTRKASESGKSEDLGTIRPDSVCLGQPFPAGPPASLPKGTNSRPRPTMKRCLPFLGRVLVLDNPIYLKVPRDPVRGTERTVAYFSLGLQRPAEVGVGHAGRPCSFAN